MSETQQAPGTAVEPTPASTITTPVTVNDNFLASMHFTSSGTRQFKDTVFDYSKQLLEKSVHYGEIDRADGLAPEITHEHVRASAHAMSASFRKATNPMWFIPANIGEYLATATAGVGGGHLDKPLGIAAFGVGISIAVILVVVRLTLGGGK
jgi:hypothetical protein